MKIRSVSINNHRHAFIVRAGGRELSFPYVLADTPPTRTDPVVSVRVDPELGREAITYRLASGAEDSLHIEHFLSANRDPGYFRDRLLEQLTAEARRRLDQGGQSRREIGRRLATSPSQLYRLLDPANQRKTLDQMVRLLAVLGGQVELSVTTLPDRRTGRPARRRPRSRAS